MIVTFVIVFYLHRSNFANLSLFLRGFDGVNTTRFTTIDSARTSAGLLTDFKQDAVKAKVPKPSKHTLLPDNNSSSTQAINNSIVDFSSIAFKRLPCDIRSASCSIFMVLERTTCGYVYNKNICKRLTYTFKHKTKVRKKITCCYKTET